MADGVRALLWGRHIFPLEFDGHGKITFHIFEEPFHVSQDIGHGLYMAQGISCARAQPEVEDNEEPLHMFLGPSIKKCYGKKQK